ncbi:Alpha/Beta hydrolase protein [Lineolata rhizophorae]|uniref:Carboxypeptidase n=1 Tax=Lineolata rhizophorae TaxID=578093 RepID=A0A6A6NLH4_9PEZI|nr:Alpha/Beta hydrolase protein [Lineolata rhizophorae]
MLFVASPASTAAWALLRLVGLLPLGVASQFVPPVAYEHVLQSPVDPAVTVLYKSPDPGTCTTAFAAQKQYSGYISLPPYTLEPVQQNYSINTFFWFFEAREAPETAPLTVWLNGGPGSSSMFGLFAENGPCEVVELEDGDGYGTQERQWGWDRSSNILYVDQPAQVGFSYDLLRNGSVNLPSRDVYSPPEPLPMFSPPYTFLNGTFSSGDEDSTANTTQIAAHAVWHFLQTFLATFPQYNPGVQPNSTRPTAATGINLFAESYGGIYGPVFATLFEDMNDRRASGALGPSNSTLEIRLASLGLVNAWLDDLTQLPHLPTFAHNNTYGIEIIGLTTMLNALTAYNSDGGCRDSVIACRSALMIEDPEGEGDVDRVNDLCSGAYSECLTLQAITSDRRISPYDIRKNLYMDFPPKGYLEYLNDGQVQKAIGARVNYTESSQTVFDAFQATGDQARSSQIRALYNLLSSDIRIALIYGDADFICNWRGGEAVSLALAQYDESPYRTGFPSAGYADIIVNSSYVGGAVRQFGNLSFSRIYNSGHFVPAYQPETAFTVFTRVIQGTDISTGEPADLDVFATEGPANATYANDDDSSADDDDDEDANRVCWLRDIQGTCGEEARVSISGGNGVVRNGVWYAREADFDPPSSSVRAGVPGTPVSVPVTPAASGSARSSAESSGDDSESGAASSTVEGGLTGVFVATGPVSSTGGAAARPVKTAGVEERVLMAGLGVMALML